MINLIWEENPSQEKMNWDEANNYAENLEEGWRLPTKEELEKASEDDLKGFNKKYYWSSSTVTNCNNNVWIVCFNQNYTSNGNNDNYVYARCVKEV